MKILKIALYVFIFCGLTILTQIGGFVFMIAILSQQWIDRFVQNTLGKTICKFLYFLILYSFFTFLIVPSIAKLFGKTPLPLTNNGHLQPLNFLTCFLNRHYVKPELKKTVLNIAHQMHKKYPGTVVNYLDANFPLFNKFPLLPHLSHNDGKKLDISFCYRDATTGRASNNCPSFLGYGICEEPRKTEINTATECEKKGYWQYNVLTKITPQGNKKNYIFDSNKTSDLIYLISKEHNMDKIFIEPHLKYRLKLTSNKIVFHGCQAVRHDDHIHLQIK